MATVIKWEEPAAIQTYLSTELNALADGGNKLGAKVDNVADAENDMFISLELTVATQASARDSGGFVAVYLLPSIDNTNFGYGDDSTDPPSSTLLWTFELDAAVTARIVTVGGLQIDPLDFKLLVINETGQVFAGSGNTLKYRIHSIESQ